MANEIELSRYAEAHAAGHVTVDVREPDEYVAGHVPDARLVPLSQIASVAGDLPTADPVYVICASGGRSKVAADVLSRAGLQAYSVRGGTAAWAQAGRPIVTGSSPT